MNETADQRVARLQAELAKAKVDQLQAELNEAQQVTGPGGPSPAQAQTGSPSSPGAKLRERLANPRYQTFSEISHDRRPPPDTRLSDPPRRVPLAMRLCVLTWSWWAIWGLFMLAVAPIGFWHSLDRNGHHTEEAVLLEGVLVIVLLWLMRKYVKRMILLRRGVVANVTGSELQSRGTYYSGTTYQNMWVTQADGWHVTRKMYSGPSSKTLINYQVGTETAHMTLRGLPYKNGVILADSRRPSRALCVNQFPYDLDRDESGDWIGRVSPRVILGSLGFWAVAVAWSVEVLRIYHGG